MPRLHSVNKHHLLFDRAAWRSSDVRVDLRENRWLIPPIDVETHQELHKAVAVVPALDFYTAARVRRDFEAEPGQFMQNMDLLQLAIEDALKHPRSSGLQRDLGALTIQAIELQKPFIEEGLVWRRNYG
jgi:hypothetical protein